MALTPIQNLFQKHEFRNRALLIQHKSHCLLSPEQIQNRYSLLYYQFVKHSFGLPHHDGPADKDVYLRLYFDEIPYPLDQRDAFKAHILSLQKFWQFRKARLKIRLDDIAEINSKKHTIQQCMDIVLGAMAFVLNKKHLETAPGTNERGKRTIAKEKLFNHIIELIKESNGCEVLKQESDPEDEHDDAEI